MPSQQSAKPNGVLFSSSKAAIPRRHSQSITQCFGLLEICVALLFPKRLLVRWQIRQSLVRGGRWFLSVDNHHDIVIGHLVPRIVWDV